MNVDKLKNKNKIGRCREESKVEREKSKPH
jgi:hypothetical protein